MLAAALAMSMSLTAQAAPAALTVNQFPEAGTVVYNIDKLDQFGTYYVGLWEGTVTVGDAQRTYKIYVPEDCRRDASAYYIALPDGVRAEEFLANLFKVPYNTSGKTIHMESGYIDKSGYKVPVFEAKVPFQDLLEGMDRNLLLNEITNAETYHKYPGVKVGSMEEAITEGNWE